VGNLPLTALDLDAGWVTFPRPKTGIPRRCPLWKETVDAIRSAIANRTEPTDPRHAGLVFVTIKGNPWHRENKNAPVAMTFGRLLHKLGINGRERLGFYGLRHTHRTVAAEAKYPDAADQLMGHELPGMRAVYVEHISDDQLRAVTDHVHDWLFPK